MGDLTGWALLLSPIPDQYKRPIHESVYRKKGLTDVNDGYLWERLHNSGFPFSIEALESTYHGPQQRSGRNGPYTVHVATARVRVTIWDEGRENPPRIFTGVGAHENMSFDAATKGAATSALGQCWKYMGQTMQLYKQGQIVDLIYAVEQAESGIAGSAAPASAPATTSPPAAQPAQAAGAIEITVAQRTALTELVRGLDPADQDEARQQAFKRVREGGPVVAIRYLMGVHQEKHGECAHVKQAAATADLWMDAGQGQAA